MAKEIFFNSVNYTKLFFDGAEYSCATSGADSIHFDGNDYLVCGAVLPPVVNCPANATQSSATAASYAVTNTGGGAVSWAFITTILPAGISFSAQSAGGATVEVDNTVPDGTYVIHPQATNSAGSDDCNFSVTVGSASVSFGPAMDDVYIEEQGTPTVPTISYRLALAADGTYTETGVGFLQAGLDSGTWLAAGSASNIEVRITVTQFPFGGSPTSISNTAPTFTALSTLQELNITLDTAVAGNTIQDIVLEFREVGTTAIIDTQSYRVELSTGI